VSRRTTGLVPICTDCATGDDGTDDQVDAPQLPYVIVNRAEDCALCDASTRRRTARVHVLRAIRAGLFLRDDP